MLAYFLNRKKNKFKLTHTIKALMVFFVCTYTHIHISNDANITYSHFIQDITKDHKKSVA